MTPLAYRFAKRLTLPIKKRERVVVGNAIDEFRDIHCFECSEINQILVEADHKTRVAAWSGELFLPAPRTWIEWDQPDHRLAVLLTEVDNDSSAFNCFLFCGFKNHDGLIADRIGSIKDYRLESDSVKGLNISGEMAEKDEHWIVGKLLSAKAFLSFINAPRIIGRRQFMPNRALERRLNGTLGVGKFPLHAWHELKLEVNKPTWIDDGEPHESHLTGRRALHFCRAHLRIRNGNLEFVQSHWRGDPALGIKQTRYRVVE